MGEFSVSACAVLPAGGSGERFGTPTPKQFCPVVGRPLVSYTLEAFERVKWIEHIVLVVSKDRRSEVEEILKVYNHKRVSLAEGQSTRHRSIYSGIQAIEKLGYAPDILLINDAVRPFVDVQILEKVALAAKEHGAAGATRPLVSTVIRTSSEGLLEESLDRSKYRASEMPQAFQHQVISKAYRMCTDYDFEFGTECLHLAQKYGGASVRLVEGSADLWKVTHKRDIYAAEGMIKEQYNKVIVTKPLLNTTVQCSLTAAMQARCLQVETDTGVDHAADPGTHYLACVHPLPPDMTPGSLDSTVEVLTRGRHPTMTAGVILVVFETDPGENPQTVGLQDCVQKIAHELLPQGMYLNLVLVKTSEAPPYLRPFADTVAELAFQRSLIFSGQTFRTRLL